MLQLGVGSVRRWALVLGLAGGLLGCKGRVGGMAPGQASPSAEPDAGEAPPQDLLSATRRLRRLSLALTNAPPASADYQALLAAPDDAAREALLDQALDRMLGSNAFYDTMLQFGRSWMPIPPIPNTADEPEYVAIQATVLTPCPDGTPHAGKLALWDAYGSHQPCDGLNGDGSAATIKDIEPWWAPGTTVSVIGRATDDRTPITVNGKQLDCGHENGAGVTPDRYSSCGCGPHLAWCYLANSQTDWQSYLGFNPVGQRRLLWEEPSRLLAHLAWYDRPLTDLIAGDYSVGPSMVQFAYVRAGRRTGATQLDADPGWWHLAGDGALVDPEHDSADPGAWREFHVPDRNPYLLAERDYHFDPRTEAEGSMRGVPAAGVLTMIGALGGLPRERVRAARFLEWFACEQFVPPPADQVFNPYRRDPATEGVCQHCHVRIDPAAIHFKRWDKLGALDGSYVMPGIGLWQFPKEWATGVYPYNGDPTARWARLWAPDTRMTPVTADLAASHPDARFIDFLPPDQSLLGQHSDGTVGPLGFAKMVIGSGAFDRCVVSRLHERFAGRAIDPGAEAGYLDTLTQQFVAGGRQVRPFLKQLAHGEVFRRGL